MPSSFSLSLLAVLAALLLIVAWGDLRARIIPNRLNAAIALMAPLWWWANGWALWPDIAWQIGFALLMFAMFAGAFAIGMMGGGDVKLIGALALWFTPVPFARLLLVMALVGGALTLVVVAEHRWRRRPGAVEVPYGVAIAIAGFHSIASLILTTLAH